jgi:hypothetical protein
MDSLLKAAVDAVQSSDRRSDAAQCVLLSTTIIEYVTKVLAVMYMH